MSAFTDTMRFHPRRSVADKLTNAAIALIIGFLLLAALVTFIVSPIGLMFAWLFVR